MNKDEKLEVFNDGHLKDLCYETIAELAKKSIRLTAENRRLEEALEEIEVIAGEGVDLPCINGECFDCRDSLTNRGDTCMQNAINRIIQKVKQVKN